MTFNIAVQQEQEQRVQADLVASRFEYESSYSKADAAIEAELNHRTDRYNEGLTDAIKHREPEINGWKTDLNYRYGWLAGIAQRYDLEIGTAYNEPF